ncbi:MAG: carbamoyltransferase HypF [Planctomycetota bacterium]|nr:carbamoyltransferase HypF [Planctomycetota bacterium]
MSMEPRRQGDESVAGSLASPADAGADVPAPVRPPARAAVEIRIGGVVQGVGFRPFVYRLATQLGLRGSVHNGSDGVQIYAEGDPAHVRELLVRLRAEAPPASVIARLESRDVPVAGHEVFAIVGSERGEAPSVRVSPDLCVCEDCLREMKDAGERRFAYPYVNCTNCGPRFSIIERLPYDRATTTMKEWPLCAACQREYGDPLDRRFHAQPVACPACGPTYRLVLAADAGSLAETRARRGTTGHANANQAERTGAAAIALAADMLRDGKILAIKGIGGYHLACDAANESVVAALRQRKFRKDKPFALLARDLKQAEQLASVEDVHRQALRSIARPIVLIARREQSALRVAPGVASGMSELGVMLASTPLQQMLIDAGAPMPMVLTSANRSSEPICYRDEDALERLAGIADAFLVGERAIARRVDDSVVAVRCLEGSGPRACVTRFGRGLAPGVVATLPAHATSSGNRLGVLALGSDLKNAIAIVLPGTGEVILSQHIGDLGDIETDRAFDETIADFMSMYELDAGKLVVAHDLHPEFVSTLRASGLGCFARVAVQHHEAHVASVIAEHASSEPELLRERVVGIAIDGTGWGRDGTIWGCEFFVGSVRDGFERTGWLRPVPMPGGDAAARHPVQAAAGRLFAVGDEITDIDFGKPPFMFPRRFADATAMIRAGVRCFTSTSAGRLFDAAAALLGFTEPVTYEGQAAIWLEQLARPSANDVAARRVDSLVDSMRLESHRQGQTRVVDETPLLRYLVAERLAGADPAMLARVFHLVLGRALAEHAVAIAAMSDARVVVLSGGVAQNALLLSAIDEIVAGAELKLLINEKVPANDGGITLGQAAIALARPGA